MKPAAKVFLDLATDGADAEDQMALYRSRPARCAS